jgi:hypothetical protein
MIKFDVALPDKLTNVTSVAAFKRAIEQRPDIISCSWGSDQRNSQLSPQDKLLAAVIARAVREGIVVIFAAGNGSWGFPAQHPDAIAVGGVYKHLGGSLKGRLEASNYASGFISPVYPERQVPDVCGLVGQLPDAAYIMLPIPPDGWRDRLRAAIDDGTLPSDGWAAFSGTSAAAPQLAGICALMKQVDPSLSPARVKQILQQTARDVVEGSNNPSAGGHRARKGRDLATGYGLADAYAAIQAVDPTKIAQSESRLQFPRLPNSNSPSLKELQNLNYSRNYSIPKGITIMNDNYSRLKQNFEKITWEFEEILEKYELHDLELSINESNFIIRSLRSKTARSLRKALNDCFPLTEKTIAKSHVLTAQSLLKLKKYQETAIEILTEVITNPKYSDSQKLQELALKALGEMSSLEVITSPETNFYNCECVDGKMICTNPSTGATSSQGTC